MFNRRTKDGNNSDDGNDGDDGNDVSGDRVNIVDRISFDPFAQRVTMHRFVVPNDEQREKIRDDDNVNDDSDSFSRAFRFDAQRFLMDCHDIASRESDECRYVDRSLNYSFFWSSISNFKRDLCEIELAWLVVTIVRLMDSRSVQDRVLLGCLLIVALE